MTDVAIGTPGTSADVVARLVRSEGLIDVPNNRSYLYADLYLKVTAANGASGPWKASPPSSASLGSSLGSLGTWSGGYDLRPASSLPAQLLIHWEGWVAHDADGKKTVSFTITFTGAGGSPLDHGYGEDSIVLSAIPRNRIIARDDEGDFVTADFHAKVNGVFVPAQLYARETFGGPFKLCGGL